MDPFLWHPLKKLIKHVWILGNWSISNMENDLQNWIFVRKKHVFFKNPDWNSHHASDLAIQHTSSLWIQGAHPFVHSLRVPRAFVSRAWGGIGGPLKFPWFQDDCCMGVSKNKGTPKWMVKIMEHPMNKWMIWGYPYFWFNTRIGNSPPQSCKGLIF